jgi:hypothetical protein
LDITSIKPAHAILPTNRLLLLLIIMATLSSRRRLQKWVRLGRSNTSIIAMLNPSRHIFRDWTPQPFPVHEDVGLEVGNENTIIRKMVRTTLGHPSNKNACDPAIICKRVARNLITELGDLNEVAMTEEQITIRRMTKTMRQDPPPPHY